jgi:hypothetical protein
MKGDLTALRTQQLDISLLANGFYFLRVINEKQGIIRKFIKMGN